VPEVLITPFARTFALPSGPRVRVRLARPSDRGALADLLSRRGLDASDPDLRGLLGFDPRERLVLAAFTPVGGSDTLAGIGAIDLHQGAEPDALVVDERLTGGLGELLGGMLIARAEAHARRAAA
jgi:hypothetical protein